jgi:effector-binding domain-containing protein
MRLNFGRRPIYAGLALFAVFLFGAGFTSPLAAQEKPTVTPPQSDTTPTPKPSTPPPVKPEGRDAEPAAPGVPLDAAAETLDIAARPTAFVQGQAKWDEGFAALMNAQAKVKEAIDKAGLKSVGRPITVFTQTDDSGFSYDAMLPLSEKPSESVQLGGDVKLGLSPSGKAIKFQHRGAYDDIDSTYDLITAYLDEKGLEARNFFVEEYETDLKTSDDPNLAVDIYVFIK